MRWPLLIGIAVGVLSCRKAAPPSATHDSQKLDLAPPQTEGDASLRIVGFVHAGPASIGWCSHLSAQNARAIGPHLLSDAGCFSPEIDCVVDDTGAGWGFEVRDAGAKDEYGSCTTDTDVGLVRSDGTGVLHGPADAGLELSQMGSPGFKWSIQSARVRPLGDYDGDGDQEVLITREWWAHEGGRGTDSSIWTLKHGALQPYAPAAGFVIDGAEDADHDGKLDLVTRGPYDQIQAWAAIGYWYPNGPSIFLAHARPDGTFSMTDSVAVAYTKTRCAAATEKNETMACERMRGKSESEVLAAEKKAQKKDGCVDFLEDLNRYPQSCPKWMPELAAVSPPFRF